MCIRFAFPCKKIKLFFLNVLHKKLLDFVQLSFQNSFAILQ